MRRFQMALVVSGALLASAALLSGAWTGILRDEEKPVALEEVPAAVRSAIQREAADGVILKIVREVERSGRVTFEAEILVANGLWEVEFASDGTVLEREALQMGGGDDDDDGDADDDDDGDDDEGDDDDGDDDDDAGGDDDDGQRVNAGDVPAAVHLALTDYAGPRGYSFSMEREHGVAVYEARWQADGRSFEAEVSADGRLLEIEETVPAEAVPPAVRQAAEARLGGAAGATFHKLTVFLYEAEAVVDGREREVLVSPTGRVIGH